MPLDGMLGDELLQHSLQTVCADNLDADLSRYIQFDSGLMLIQIVNIINYSLIL